MMPDDLLGVIAHDTGGIMLTLLSEDRGDLDYSNDVAYACEADFGAHISPMSTFIKVVSGTIPRKVGKHELAPGFAAFPPNKCWRSVLCFNIHIASNVTEHLPAVIHAVSYELDASLHIPTKRKIQLGFFANSQSLARDHLIDGLGTFQRVPVGNILASMHKLKCFTNNCPIIIIGQRFFAAAHRRRRKLGVEAAKIHRERTYVELCNLFGQNFCESYCSTSVSSLVCL